MLNNIQVSFETGSLLRAELAVSDNRELLTEAGRTMVELQVGPARAKIESVVSVC